MRDFNHVTIVGAGTMGAGIAQWFCQQNVQTQLVDISEEVRNHAKNSILKSWDKLLSKGKFSPDEISKFKNLLSTCAQEEINPQTELVIEAIIENQKIKEDLFKFLDQHCQGHTIFASNTSSLSISQLSMSLSKARQKNFLGLHFFNPATIMKLVEIIPTAHTASELPGGFEKWLEQKGKKPATCKDSPGFIVNRVARNFYGEALRIAAPSKEETYREIDSVLKECGNFRMGPFELMDLIGIDVNYKVTQSVWESFYYESRFAPHPLQRTMVQSGQIGKKAKKGFYSYD